MNTPPVLPIRQIAKIIQSLTVEQLLELRRLLAEEGGDPTGVGAVIPPDLPLKGDAVAQPLPEDYWETAE